jgi:hypothetical protein
MGFVSLYLLYEFVVVALVCINAFFESSKAWY